MKGYKTSRDYSLLWELINKGYTVIGIFSLKKRLANLFIHAITKQPCINEDAFQGIDDFTQTLKAIDLQFIPPTTDLISKKSIGELIDKIYDKLQNDEPSAFIFGFDFVMDELKDFIKTETE